MMIKSIIKSQYVFLILLAGFLMPKVAFAEETTSRLYIRTDQHTHIVREDGRDAIITKDYLNSTRIVARQGNTSVSEKSYYPYGEDRISEDNPDTTNRLFTDHRKLDDLSIYHAGARFYSPRLGRFIQSDTIEGPNRYTYVVNNPISNIDPTGNVCIPCVIGGVALFSMISTSPGGSDVDTPGSEARYQDWEQGGGQEFNYAMSRMVPVVGQTQAITELVTGQDTLGRRVSGASQLFNALDVAGGGIASLSTLDNAAGGVNTAIQQRRIMNLPEAQAVFGNSVDEGLELALRDHQVFGQRAADALELDDLQFMPGGSIPGYPDGHLGQMNNTLSIAYRDPKILPHETVHAMQVRSGHQLHSGPAGALFDAENMAYAGTNLAGDPLSLQLYGALGSTQVWNPGTSRTLSLLGGINRNYDYISAGTRGLGQTFSIAGQVGIRSIEGDF